MAEEIKPFKTSDTGLAGYLFAKEMRILGTIPDSSDPKRRHYVFVDHEKRPEWVEEYITGHDMVSAKYYNRSISMVKRYLSVEVNDE